MIRISVDEYERLRAAEATLTAARAEIGVWRRRAALNLENGIALGMETNRCADELEAALTASPATKEAE